MASVLGPGPVTWRAERDDDGYRSYYVTYRVKAAVTESPAAVMYASGLPVAGSAFNLAGYTGSDQWCWCWPTLKVDVDQKKSGDPPEYYLVECKFGNKWEHRAKRCHSTNIEDPLLEPMKIRGNFNKGQWEAKYDMYGNRLVTSANEALTGPGVTFDYAKTTVLIEQNVGALGLSTFANMVNTVNISPLWGCPARCIKLTNAPWEKKYWGTCHVFYTRTFEFEIDNYNCDEQGNPIGHDKIIHDTGSMVLRGYWQTDVDRNSLAYGSYKLMPGVVDSTTPETVLTTPQSNFAAYKDMNNQPARVALDGAGRPAKCRIVPNSGPEFMSGPPASRRLSFYRESNFLELGIPTTL